MDSEERGFSPAAGVSRFLVKHLLGRVYLAREGLRPLLRGKARPFHGVLRTYFFRGGCASRPFMLTISRDAPWDLDEIVWPRPR